MDRDFVFQQDGALPWRDYFLPQPHVVAWIGRGGTIAWLPRSPDLTSLDFSVWGYDKDKVFVPTPPASLEELWARITEAVATIDVDMIQKIWDEFAYRWDICRVSRENQI
jgi:hypothetical protein